MVNKAGRTMRKAEPRSSGFKYKARSADDVKKRSEQTGGRFETPWKSGLDVWRPKQGDNVIRILPPTWDEHEHYGFDVWVHSYVGSDSSTFLCLAKMKNKDCPICAAAKEAKAAGEDDEAKQLGNKKLTVCWIIDRDEKEPQPQLFAMSWTQDRDIAALCHNKRTGKVLLIDHPDEGYDLTIKRQGQGLKTKYFGLAVDRDSSPIFDDPDDQEKVLEFIQDNPVPSILVAHSAEHMEKAIDGTAPAKDEDLDEDDEDAPRKKKARVRNIRGEEEEEIEDEAPPKKKRAPVDDDEDEDEPAPKKRRAPVEEEEEDEDAPPPKKRRAAAEPEEEEEDEDEAPPKKRRAAPAEEEEEEVEEDPAPRRRRAPVEEEEEDEDEAPPKKRRAPVEEEEEDDEPAPRTRIKRR